MMNEELITEIKRQIAGIKTAIAVANEQRERYAETRDILHCLLNLAEESVDEQSRKEMVE